MLIPLPWSQGRRIKASPVITETPGCLGNGRVLTGRGNDLTLTKTKTFNKDVESKQIFQGGKIYGSTTQFNSNELQQNVGYHSKDTG